MFNVKLAVVSAAMGGISAIRYGWKEREGRWYAIQLPGDKVAVALGTEPKQV